MISSLRGVIINVGQDHAVVECAGVGYLVWASPRTLAGLRRGSESLILTHLAVKDDAMTLYGFGDVEERKMFLLLQSLSGMGPKLALATVGTLAPSEIAAAVSTQNAKLLQTVPGVGKRMADRMIVELKDKVAEFAAPVGSVAQPEKAAQSAGESSSGSAAAMVQTAAHVTEALVGLGFPERTALPVVHETLSEDPEASVSAALKSALTRLGRN